MENPDILATIAARKKQRPKLVIGFAAETENVVANAKAKLARKDCDWILANDVSPQSGIMGGDSNTITLVTRIRRRALAAAKQRRRLQPCWSRASRMRSTKTSAGTSRETTGESDRSPHHALAARRRSAAAVLSERAAAGLDLLAAVSAATPLILAPGERASGADRHRDRAARRLRSAGAPALRARRTHGLTVLNAPGTIDADYRGEIQVLLVNLGNEAVTITRGMRIAQLVIAPVVRAQILEVAIARQNRAWQRRFWFDRQLS